MLMLTDRVRSNNKIFLSDMIMMQLNINKKGAVKLGDSRMEKGLR